MPPCGTHQENLSDSFPLREIHESRSSGLALQFLQWNDDETSHRVSNFEGNGVQLCTVDAGTNR